MTTSRDLLDAIASGENSDAKEMFGTLVGERVKAAMDKQYSELGNAIFSVEEAEQIDELMSKGALDKVDVDAVKDPVDRGRAFVLKQAAKEKGGTRKGLIGRQQQYKKNAEPIRKAAKDRGEI